MDRPSSRAPTVREPYGATTLHCKAPRRLRATRNRTNPFGGLECLDSIAIGPQPPPLSKPPDSHRLRLGYVVVHNNNSQNKQNSQLQN